MYQTKRLEFNLNDEQEMKDFHTFIDILLRKRDKQICIWANEQTVSVEYDYIDLRMAEGSLIWLRSDEEIVQIDDEDYL